VESIDVHVPDAADPARAVLGAIRDRLAGDRRLPLRDVAFEARIPAERLHRLFLAAGRLRDEDRYGDDDVAYAHDVAVLLERFEAGRLERMLRLHQRAANTVVVNQLALIQNDPRLAPLLEPDAELPDQLVEALIDDAEQLIPLTQRLLARDHHEAMLRLLDSTVVADASRSTRETIDLAVGFIDLVGFTRLSASVDPGSVGEVLGGFEDGVHEAAMDVGDVLVVKFIGDAAMVVGGEVDDVLEVCRRVVEEPTGHGDEVDRRAGVAVGEVAIRDGDYLGTAVNLAARLTDLARPGSVLLDESGAEDLDHDRWHVRRLRARKLKGLGRCRPSRVERRDDV
jgi:adenylate cyclase